MINLQDYQTKTSFNPQSTDLAGSRDKESRILRDERGGSDEDPLSPGVGNKLGEDDEQDISACACENFETTSTNKATLD